MQGPIEVAAVLADMAWRVKAAARYNAIDVSDAHPQAAELDGLLAVLAAHKKTRVVLFYLRENVPAIETQLDVPHYDEQSARFVARVRDTLHDTRLQLLELPSSDFAGMYTDHIHLNARGYTILGRALLARLQD